MKKYNREKGRVGEGMAERLLVKKGYETLERNFRTRWGEIDLICAKSGVLVFVEVKTKMGDNFGSPEEMVSNRKLKQVERTAESYLMLNPKVGRKYEKYRVDVVAVVMDKEEKEERVTHYENVEGL